MKWLTGAALGALLVATSSMAALAAGTTANTSNSTAPQTAAPSRHLHSRRRLQCGDSRRPPPLIRKRGTAAPGGAGSSGDAGPVTLAA